LRPQFNRKAGRKAKGKIKNAKIKTCLWRESNKRIKAKSFVRPFSFYLFHFAFPRGSQL
jgi:hypothetical protein